MENSKHIKKNWKKKWKYIHGSFHHDDPRFGANSGKQSIPNAVMFLCGKQPHSLKTRSLDAILEDGDKLYTQICQILGHSQLTIDDVPQTFIYGRYKYLIHISLPLAGVINDTQTLRAQIVGALSISDAFLLLCQGQSIAVKYYSASGMYLLFDSDSCAKQDHSPIGKACISRLTNLICLLKHVPKHFPRNGHKREFMIVPMKVTYCHQEKNEARFKAIYFGPSILARFHLARPTSESNTSHSGKRNDISNVKSLPSGGAMNPMRAVQPGIASIRPKPPPPPVFPMSANPPVNNTPLGIPDEEPHTGKSTTTMATFPKLSQSKLISTSGRGVTYSQAISNTTSNEKLVPSRRIFSEPMRTVQPDIPSIRPKPPPPPAVPMSANPPVNNTPLVIPDEEPHTGKSTTTMATFPKLSQSMLTSTSGQRVTYSQAISNTTLNKKLVPSRGIIPESMGTGPLDNPSIRPKPPPAPAFPMSANAPVNNTPPTVVIPDKEPHTGKSTTTMATFPKLSQSKLISTSGRGVTYSQAISNTTSNEKLVPSRRIFSEPMRTVQPDIPSIRPKPPPPPAVPMSANPPVNNTPLVIPDEEPHTGKSTTTMATFPKLSQSMLTSTSGQRVTYSQAISNTTLNKKLVPSRGIIPESMGTGPLDNPSIRPKPPPAPVFPMSVHPPVNNTPPTIVIPDEEPQADRSIPLMPMFPKASPAMLASTSGLYTTTQPAGTHSLSRQNEQMLQWQHAHSSFHQGDPRFGPNSGKQSLPNSVMFLCQMSRIQPSTLRNDFIDDLLQAGDKLYTQICRLLGHHEMNIDHMPQSFVYGACKYDIRSGLPLGGVIGDADRLKAQFFWVLSIGNAFLLSCQGKCIAVKYDPANRNYIIFDPHCSKDGLPCPYGKACVTMYTDFNLLLQNLPTLFANSGQREFVIVPIEVMPQPSYMWDDQTIKAIKFHSNLSIPTSGLPENPCSDSDAPGDSYSSHPVKRSTDFLPSGGSFVNLNSQPTCQDPDTNILGVYPSMIPYKRASHSASDSDASSTVKRYDISGEIPLPSGGMFVDLMKTEQADVPSVQPVIEIKPISPPPPLFPMSAHPPVNNTPLVMPDEEPMMSRFSKASQSSMVTSPTDPAMTYPQATLNIEATKNHSRMKWKKDHKPPKSNIPADPGLERACVTVTRDVATDPETEPACVTVTRDVGTEPSDGEHPVVIPHMDGPDVAIKREEEGSDGEDILSGETFITDIKTEDEADSADEILPSYSSDGEDEKVKGELEIKSEMGDSDLEMLPALIVNRVFPNWSLDSGIDVKTEDGGNSTDDVLLTTYSSRIIESGEDVRVKEEPKIRSEMGGSASDRLPVAGNIMSVHSQPTCQDPDTNILGVYPSMISYKRANASASESDASQPVKRNKISGEIPLPSGGMFMNPIRTEQADIPSVQPVIEIKPISPPPPLFPMSAHPPVNNTPLGIPDEEPHTGKNTTMMPTFPKLSQSMLTSTSGQGVTYSQAISNTTLNEKSLPNGEIFVEPMRAVQPGIPSIRSEPPPPPVFPMSANAPVNNTPPAIVIPDEEPQADRSIPLMPMFPKASPAILTSPSGLYTTTSPSGTHSLSRQNEQMLQWQHALGSCHQGDSVMYSLHAPPAVMYSQAPEVAAYTSNRSAESGDNTRKPYTYHQLLELEKHFHNYKYIRGTQKRELADSLCLTDQQIKIWFQNRRTKWKKDNKLPKDGSRTDRYRTSLCTDR